LNAHTYHLEVKEFAYNIVNIEQLVNRLALKTITEVAFLSYFLAKTVNIF